MDNEIASGIQEREVRIPIRELRLVGSLALPENSSGVVLFAHGSGSSRQSPRNRFVARTLQERGLGTLLMDLLTVEEEEVDAYTGQLRFDIALLTNRLIGATDWISRHPDTQQLPIGYFGASTGAAAALAAAAKRRSLIRAIVSRGGRPDLAASALGRVRAPTLLIVGGADPSVIQLNESALREINGAERKLEIVLGATHLFEEPGALEQVAHLAAEWFEKRLKGS